MQQQSAPQGGNMQKVPLPKQTFESQSRSAAYSKVLNMYSEDLPAGAISSHYLIGCAGLELFATLGSNAEISVAYTMRNVIYAISNSVVYKITAAGVVSVLDSIPNSTSYNLTDNGFQILAILDDGTGYIITESAVTEITDANFPLSSSCTFLDGFFVVSEKDTQKFYISNSYDGLLWGEGFVSAEEKPDNLVAMFGFNSTLLAFGTETIEFFQNIGASDPTVDVPYRQINGTAITTIGCLSRDTIQAAQNTVFFLGTNNAVYAIYGAQSFSPEKISTVGIESIIQVMTNPANSIGYIYSVGSHRFYCLTFVSDDITLCYDTLTGVWHQRDSYGLGRWRINTITSLGNIYIGGDYDNGKLYKIHLGAYTDDDLPIVKKIVTQPFFSNSDRISYNAVQLLVEAGQAPRDGIFSDPVVMLSFSDDGGYTYGNELSASIGKTGQYKNIVVFRRCGLARNRVFSFSCADATKFNINGLLINASICSS